MVKHGKNFSDFSKNFRSKRPKLQLFSLTHDFIDGLADFNRLWITLACVLHCLTKKFTDIYWILLSNLLTFYLLLAKFPKNELLVTYQLLYFWNRQVTVTKVDLPW